MATRSAGSTSSRQPASPDPVSPGAGECNQIGAGADNPCRCFPPWSVQGVQITTFIFDFDGTLADTLPVCIESFQQTLERHTGRSWTEEEIVAHFGLSEEGILQRLMPEHWPHCLTDFLEIYAQRHDTVHPFPGVEEMLEELKRRGGRLALVTGKGEATARISLGHLDLARHFERIEVGSPERNVKADHIRRLLRESGTPPARAAYIGDAPSDMNSAREAGVLALGAAWFESADAEALRDRGAAEVFRTLEEFLRWVANQ